MRNYFDIVPISAKVRKKQSRMCKFCIILAVFLITVIFGMADMFIRSQIMQSEIENGKWHILIRDISDEKAALISSRPEIKYASRYGTLNFRGEQGYTLSGKNLIICGSDESWATKMIVDFIVEGKFPQNDNEAIITESAKNRMGLQIGDSIEVNAPDGKIIQYTISGFMQNVSKTMSEDSYAIFLTTSGFRTIYFETGKNELVNHDTVALYIQFSNNTNMQEKINNIKSQFELSDKQISENTKLLGLLGQSSNSFMAQIYGAAVVLFLLVMLAGVLMITSSLNSNIAQRTEFFGMIRCIGATPKQVMKLVRKEALGWCKLAIPLGITIGIVIIWGICAVLRYLSPAYFAAMPIFGISFPSILAGVCIGILTVLLAARSPAKRASKVSPLVAVSGNANNLQSVRMVANTKLFKVDTSLGMYHAKASRKNLFLMVGSFALSIILFLAFSVTIDFMNHTLTPLHPWTADISIISPEQTRSVDKNLFSKLQDNTAIKRAYGRMFAYNVPIIVNGEERLVDIISYEKYQFEWADNYLIEGSLEKVQNEELAGLIVFEPQNNIRVGNTISLDKGEQTFNVDIVGMLSESPFNNAADVGTIICSESTFQKLLGESDYTIIDIQLTKDATETDVDALRELVGAKYIFSDERLDNLGVMGSYYSFGMFIYGFLIIIAMITIFNIINSISMSIAARIKQYGVFKAIGLSNYQLMKMVIAEAATYAVLGGILGSAIGMVINKILFTKLITFHWGSSWSIPLSELAIVLLLLGVSVLLAVRIPMKRLYNMSIVGTIASQ